MVKESITQDLGITLIMGGTSPKCDVCSKSPSEHNNPQHPIAGREPSDHYYYETDDGKE